MLMQNENVFLNQISLKNVPLPNLTKNSVILLFFIIIKKYY